MKAHKEVVESITRVSEELKNSVQQLKKLVDSQNNESRESNIILHNIPESTSQDPAIRKQHDAQIFSRCVVRPPGE